MTRLSATDRWLLRRIDGGDVTWRNTSRGPTYRLWVNEDTTETVTRRARRLVDAGLARRWTCTGRGGGVELTTTGRIVLDHQEATPDA